MQDNDLTNIINDMEEVTGREYTDKEKVYALHLATTGNKAFAARESGVPAEHSRQEGYKLALDPDIQTLVDGIRRYRAEYITPADIESGILAVALTADNARDKLNAYALLGKGRGMYRDQIDISVQRRPDVALLDAIQTEFGLEARERAEQDLGYPQSDKPIIETGHE